jgi:uncharacterized protein
MFKKRRFRMGTQNLEKKQIPAVEGTFTWPSTEPRFVGSKCKACGTVSFPKTSVCRNPSCKNKGEVEETLLSRRGKLLSFTLICYQPPPPFVAPKPFVPFPIGEVQFPEGIAILGQITGRKYEELKTGMEVETVVEKLFVDEQGNEVVGWKFRPL